MKINYRLNEALFLFFLALPFLYGCPPSAANITLTVTNCPKDNIRIVFSDSGIIVSNPYKIVQAKVTIYCNNEIVSNAEVMVDFPFLSSSSFTPIKNITDPNGQIFINQRIISDPSGKNLEVKITGSDGDKTVTMTIPPLP